MDSGYLSLFEGSHAPEHPFSFWGGPRVQKLENEWSQYYGCKHSVSVNSATSGLYAAIGALEIGYGDEVIVSPYTMSACATCALVYGAIPVFADIEKETGCLDPRSIEKSITSHTKAIVVVHQFGHPANMPEIMKIAKKNNIKVVEDCAQAHGAKLDDKYVGTFGDIGVFSLNVNKTIQTGEGGICITNDDELRYRLGLIRNHGEAVVGPANYDHIVNTLGFNYRLTELCAAIASVQLEKLDDINKARIDFVNYFESEIENIPYLNPLKTRVGGHSTHYIHAMRFDEQMAGMKRDEYVKILNAEGASFYQGYTRPLYLQPIYQQQECFKNGYPFKAPINDKLVKDYKKGRCPVAENLYENEMILNEHIRLPQSHRDIEDIVAIIKKVHGLL